MFQDRLFREQTLFELYESDSERLFNEAIQESLDKINTKILKTNSEWTRTRLRSVYASLAKEINPHYEKLLKTLPKDAFNTIDSLSFTKLPKKTVEEILNPNRLVQGYPFKDLMKLSKDKHTREFRRTIAAGVSRGLPANQIVKDLTTLNTKLTKKQLKNSIYTYVSESRAIARHANFEEMEKQGLIDGYEYVATLDGRTTEYCRNHDGRKYWQPINNIQNQINVHFHCRSVFVPLDEDDKKSTRASKDGPVIDIPYGQWFKTQEPEFQRKVLGNKKYKAYVEGSYEVGGLPDVKGQTLNSVEVVALATPILFAEGASVAIQESINNLDIHAASIFNATTPRTVKVTPSTYMYSLKEADKELILRFAPSSKTIYLNYINNGGEINTRKAERLIKALKRDKRFTKIELDPFDNMRSFWKKLGFKEIANNKMILIL